MSLSYCRACSTYFISVPAFDTHQYEIITQPEKRNKQDRIVEYSKVKVCCMNASEMQQKGLASEKRTISSLTSEGKVTTDIWYLVKSREDIQRRIRQK